MTLPWTPGRLGDLSGKRIVATGATNGVGLGTARALAKAGALTESRTDTVDGLEKTLGTSLLGPFALTNLLPRVRSRIVAFAEQETATTLEV